MSRNFLIFYFIVIACTFIIYLIVLKRIDEIENSSTIYIGRFTHIYKVPKSSADYFFRFYDGNFRIKNIRTGKNIPKGFANNLGKFYKLKYLSKYPDLIVVLYDQEVKDTSMLLKEGFKIEELRIPVGRQIIRPKYFRIPD